MKKSLSAFLITSAAIAYYLKKKYENNDKKESSSFDNLKNNVDEIKERLEKIDDLFEKHEDVEENQNYQDIIEVVNKVKEENLTNYDYDEKAEAIKETKYNPLEELKAEYQIHKNSEVIKDDVSKVFITEKSVNKILFPETNPLLKFQVDENIDFKNDLEVDTSNDIVIDSQE